MVYGVDAVLVWFFYHRRQEEITGVEEPLPAEHNPSGFSAEKSDLVLAQIGVPLYLAALISRQGFQRVSPDKLTELAGKEAPDILAAVTTVMEEHVAAPTWRQQRQVALEKLLEALATGELRREDLL
ncbi:MAG: hypothetical protein AAB360_03290 [Patescibacteria group bacterium]